MDKKLLIITFFLALAFCFLVSLIEEKNKSLEINTVLDNLIFKEEYEKLNGTFHLFDRKKIRIVHIKEENPMVYIEEQELLKKLENQETFIIYFGKADSSFNRSIIETLLEVAENLSLKKIYYLNENIITTMNIESQTYQELINIVNNDIEKPKIIAIVNGKISKITTGISEKQIDGYMELTEDMLDEMYRQIECVLKCVTEKDCIVESEEENGKIYYDSYPACKSLFT